MSLPEKDRALIERIAPWLLPPPNAEVAATLATLQAAREEAYKEGWNDREGDLIAGVNRIMPEEASQEGAGEPVADEYGDRTETCERCKGNGEIVTDWDRYLGAPQPGDEGDEGTVDCPDCDGIGKVSPPNPQARIEALEGALKDTLTHLLAAISLLESSPKTAAPSNKMFDHMLKDYRASAKRAQAALNQEANHD